MIGRIHFTIQAIAACLLCLLIFYIGGNAECSQNSKIKSDQYFDGVDDVESQKVMENAIANIEKIRKRDLTVYFFDESGFPVKGIADIRLKKHEFHFGAAIKSTLSLKDSEASKQKALDICEELFNMVTIVNHWGIEQPTINSTLNFRQSDKHVLWAEKKNLDMRFHALLYINKLFTPSWRSQIMTTNDWWPLIEERIRSVADRYGQKIYEYDVLNEIFQHGKWRKTNAPTFPDLFDPKVVSRIFHISRKHLPNAKLILLEHFYPTISSTNKIFQYYYELNKALIKFGTPYDGIGLQAHFYTNKSSFQEGNNEGGKDTFRMKEIEKGLDHLAELGKPIYITEFNPPSRSASHNFESTFKSQAKLSDKEIAQWSINFYTLAFSKGYIKEIVRWFLIDGIGGKGVDAGLVKRDGQLKEEYYALRALLKEKWSTQINEKLQNGKIEFKGFYGVYEVKIGNYDNAVFTLKKNSPERLKLILKKKKYK